MQASSACNAIAPFTTFTNSWISWEYAKFPEIIIKKNVKFFLKIISKLELLNASGHLSTV